jgi:hypothetical protein
MGLYKLGLSALIIADLQVPMRSDKNMNVGRLIGPFFELSSSHGRVKRALVGTELRLTRNWAPPRDTAALTRIWRLAQTGKCIATVRPPHVLPHYHRSRLEALITLSPSTQHLGLHHTCPFHNDGNHSLTVYKSQSR